MMRNDFFFFFFVFFFSTSTKETNTKEGGGGRKKKSEKELANGWLDTRPIAVSGGRSMGLVGFRMCSLRTCL